MTGKTILGHFSEILPSPADTSVDPLLSGLRDLRQSLPTSDKTQRLGEAELKELQTEYQALRGAAAKIIAPAGPPYAEQEEHVYPDLEESVVAKRRRWPRLLWTGLAVAIFAALALGVSYRARGAGQQGHPARARETRPSAPDVVRPKAAPGRPARAPGRGAPRAALEALARGDRAEAQRRYAELARYEKEPGPYGAAAAILARELRAGE